MTPEQLSRLRQGVYRFVGAGFSYPRAEAISAAAGVMTVLDDLDIFDFAFAPEMADAAEALARSDLEELSIAYVALFEAGVAGAACPAHESAYRANPRTGEVADLQSALKRTILRYGLTVDGESPDMLDHIATEMHVMAMLCRRETELHAAARRAGRVITQQHEFLNVHLLPWVPEFTGLVRAREKHQAYTALAGAANAFLAHERQLLPLLAAEARAEA